LKYSGGELFVVAMERGSHELKASLRHPIEAAVFVLEQNVLLGQKPGEGPFGKNWSKCPLKIIRSKVERVPVTTS
jgi:hypothetical protein